MFEYEDLSSDRLPPSEIEEGTVYLSMLRRSGDVGQELALRQPATVQFLPVPGELAVALCVLSREVLSVIGKVRGTVDPEGSLTLEDHTVGEGYLLPYDNSDPLENLLLYDE